MRSLIILIAVAVFAAAGCKSEKKSDNAAKHKADPAKDSKSATGDKAGTTPADDPNSAPAPADDKATSGGTPTMSKSPKGEAPKAEDVLKAPGDEGTPAAKDMDGDCMKKCMQENQMRAVGIEVIESDCKALCARK